MSRRLLGECCIMRATAEADGIIMERATGRGEATWMWVRIQRQFCDQSITRLSNGFWRLSVELEYSTARDAHRPEDVHGLHKVSYHLVAKGIKNRCSVAVANAKMQNLFSAFFGTRGLARHHNEGKSAKQDKQSKRGHKLPKKSPIAPTNKQPNTRFLFGIASAWSYVLGRTPIRSRHHECCLQ